jgi:phenylacetate-CoA ligase
MVMKMGKRIFVLAHQLGDRRFYSTFQWLMKNQWSKFHELKEQQEKQLRVMIRFAYENVPYYHEEFRKLGLYPDDIKQIKDLEKLPLVNREIIQKHWKEFMPLNLKDFRYYERATGGSTGTPLKYRLEKFDRFLGGAVMYRGWSYGGYNLGDRMVFLAGSSLEVGVRSNLSNKLHELLRNTKFLSSFDMGENEMRSYVDVINRFKPMFFRGYASSLYFFAKWIDENDVRIHKPRSVFTTSEKLFPEMREIIENVFECEVYDGYGLNDGGVNACECSEHCGLHIDTERSIMEIVDSNNNQIDEGEGRIIATSLYNYAMPFIRYETGDIGYLVLDKCGCGRQYRLLREVIGRTVDFLVTPDGKMVHGWFFLYIFWNYCKGIREYQVVQTNKDRIVIRLVIDSNFDPSQLDLIRNIVKRKGFDWEIEFEFVEKIEKSRSGKYKFIESRVNDYDH